jgi:primosomal replication protein N
VIGSDTSFFVVTGTICAAADTYDTKAGKPKTKIFVKAKKAWNGGGFESIMPITIDGNVQSQQVLTNLRLGTRVEISGYMSSFEKEGTSGTFYNLALNGQNVAIMDDAPVAVDAGAPAGEEDVPF